MSEARPCVFVSCFAARKPPKRGHGRVLSIMALPREWEHGEGRVWALVPRADWVRWVKAGKVPLEQYREWYEAMLSERSELLAPGILTVSLGADYSESVPVQDGDTLCCCCSEAAARAGECHRSWCVKPLQLAGWTVLLDGVKQ